MKPNNAYSTWRYVITVKLPTGIYKRFVGKTIDSVVSHPKFIACGGEYVGSELKLGWYDAKQKFHIE